MFSSMKNFARIMGLLFDSAGAHSCPKSGQVAPPPPPAINEALIVDSNKSKRVN